MSKLKIEMLEDHARDMIEQSMTVRVTDEDANSVDIKFSYNEERTVIETLNDASLMSNSFDIDVIARTCRAIADAFTEDHELYSDVFYDQENFDPITLIA
jgi:hypothetical protein